MNSRRLRRAWIAWAVVCVCWGTTYLAIKIGLETIPPFVMAGFRYVSAGFILVGLLRARGRALPPRAAWPGLALLGFFLMTLGNGGVVWGEQFIPSGLTAVILATVPFWMVGMQAFMPGGDRLNARQWTGLAIGFAGIVLLVWPEIFDSGAHVEGFVAGVIALQIACVGWAIGSNYTRRHVMPRDVIGSAALQMIFGGLIMLAVGGVTGEWGRIAFSPRTTVALVYLALVGSVIGFACYSYALQHLPVAVVSLYTFVCPVLAVALGTIVLGEPFHSRMLLAAGVIVAGILIVRPARSKPETAAG